MHFNKDALRKIAVMEERVAAARAALADFIQLYCTTLVSTVRSSLPVMVLLATRFERSATWAELLMLQSEMEEWMRAIRRMTLKN